MRLRHRVAALGVGAAVVGGAALWGAGVGGAATATLTLVYNCPFPLIGAQDMSVRIVVDDLPDEAVVGGPIPQARVTATATVPDLATQGLALVGAATVEGTAKARTRVDNAGFGLDIVPNLTVAKTPVPASGAFDAIASGTTPPVSFPNAGTTTITVGDFETTLTPRKADGSLTGLGTFTSPCTLKPGQSTQLYQFTVRPDATTTTTTTQPTTTTTGITTTTSPTTTTTTTTTRPTTTTTTPTSATTTSTSSSTTTSAPTSTSTTTTSARTTSSPLGTTTTTTAQAVPPVVNHPGGNGELADTGSSIKGPLVLGGALLALGVGVLLHLRRTRRRA